MLRNILLISTAPGRVSWLEDIIGESPEGPFRLYAVDTCAEGLARLHAERDTRAAAIFVELVPGDSACVEAVELLVAASSPVPVIVICQACAEASARQAVRSGAQDYLITERLTDQVVLKALSGALERSAFCASREREMESAQITLQSIGDAVLSVDAAGNVTYLNPVAEQMTGWSLREALGLPASTVLQIRDSETRLAMPDPLEMAMLYDKPVGLAANAVLIHRNGQQSCIEDTCSPIHDRRGRQIGAVIVFHDVSQTRALVRRMSHLAQHDPLTDLPNRVLLRDRLSHGIESVLRHGTMLAILFLDLDGFKQVNDRFGHAAGDALLKSVSRQLVGCVRSSDTVSRHGGDEFVILLSEIARPRNVVVVADNMLRAVAAPRQLADRELSITASIGIAVFPHDGTNCETLLQNADSALLAAKTRGRGKYCFHAQTADIRALRRLSAVAAGSSPA